MCNILLCGRSVHSSIIDTTFDIAYHGSFEKAHLIGHVCRMKRIAVLGSTGSVGKNALAVIEAFPERYCVDALAAGRNWTELAIQARRFKPALVALADDTHATELAAELRDLPVRLHVGPHALDEVTAATNSETVVCGVSGCEALSAMLAAARRGLRLAIASKELLVVAGELLTRAAAEGGAQLIPVDSEHSALFQILRTGDREHISKVMLTASGGPFLDCDTSRLSQVTPEQALEHPAWNMGRKTTIDSGTLINKALEIVEAVRLFSFNPEHVEVVIHPQAVVHSMIQYTDGAIMAQMSAPDMRLPILYALSYPARAERGPVALDLTEVGELTFRKAEPDRFPALELGYEVARRGGTLGAVMCAADEVAVRQFLDGKITFDRIVPTVAEVMKRHTISPAPSLEDIVDAIRWATEEALLLS